MAVQGMLAFQFAGVQQWATVSVNVGGLAGGMAALRNGGLNVLLAQRVVWREMAIHLNKH